MVLSLPRGGIVIDAESARAICSALLSVNDRLNRHGGRLNFELMTLVAQIRSAIGETEPAPRGFNEHVEYELIDAQQAASILGCSPRNVRSLAAKGRLPGAKPGGRWQFNREDIEVYRDYKN
ncbi:helix-turn-helix domain-containing protein [Corynebacterium sp. HMSC074A09]|uniref:helix-turn-helix domain-containing protein n=1 Tax=Corynebacterium sp. HMSC074A09 TaxID=1739311 RepID=UPI0008A21637|nr:helix-turn-helix domain-containing protein [Corynebacterium sp. HMSC074A09]OFK67463.1 hypothetical protein HMPREF2807_06225 [Corynebacterium sp. HMSC074A09]